MDKDEFHAFYERHASDVLRFALYLAGERALAEDVAAETFARAWTATATVRTETVRAYLFAIVRNLVRANLRKRQPPASLRFDPPDARPEPAQEIGERQELEAVLGCLQLLPEGDRAALLMRAQDDMPYEEIARVLGTSVGAARVQVHRARLALGALKLRQERLP